MKKVNIFFAVLTLLFVSCQQDRYEVNPLAKTGVYEITNAKADAPVRYTLYYELGSFIVWNTTNNIEGEYKIVDLKDYSSGDNKAFDLEVENADGVRCKYSVEAPYNGVTAKGIMVVSKAGEKSRSYTVTVADEVRWTDYFNE